MTDNTTYTATFTLTQYGLDGEVSPNLEFSPLVNPVDEEAPAIYEYMSNVVLRFLQQVNVIDERFNLKEGQSLEGVGLSVKTDATKH